MSLNLNLTLRNLSKTSKTNDVINSLALYDFNFATGQIKGAQWSDAVVTRASAAYALNAAGAYESFGSNVLRRTNLGVTIEEARQNLLLQSSGFSTSWASGSGGDASVTANSGTAPDGTNTAVLLGDANGSSILGRSQNVVITSGTGLYTVSVHFKAGTSSVASLRVTLGGGTIVTAEGIINLANGATQWRSGVSGTALSSVSLGNGWYRLIVTVTDNASGNNFLGCEVRPAFASTYSNVLDAAAQGNVLAWGAQVEQGSFATSPIITSGSALTRPADVVYWPVTLGTGYSLYTDADTPPLGYTAGAAVEAWASANDRFRINNFGTGFSLTYVSGGVATVGASGVSYGSNRKVASRASGTDNRLATSGTLSAVAANAAPSVAPTRAYIGSGAGGASQYHNAVIRRLAILPALTDAQLQAFTS